MMRGRGGVVQKLGRELSSQLYQSLHFLVRRRSRAGKSDATQTIEQKDVASHEIVHTQGITKLFGRVAKVQKGAFLILWIGCVFHRQEANDGLQHPTVDPTFTDIQAHHFHAVSLLQSGIKGLSKGVQPCGQ